MYFNHLLKVRVEKEKGDEPKKNNLFRKAPWHVYHDLANLHVSKMAAHEDREMLVRAGRASKFFSLLICYMVNFLFCNDNFRLYYVINAAN